MKNIALSVAALLLPLLLSAQSPEFTALYDAYTGKEGFTTVDMSGDMFRAINSAALSQDDRCDVSRIIIIVDETNSAQFRNDVKRLLDNGDYKKISTVRSGGENVEFYVMRGEGDYREFLMNTYGSTEHVVMLVTGDGLDIGTISNIAGSNVD